MGINLHQRNFLNRTKYIDIDYDYESYLYIGIIWDNIDLYAEVVIQIGK